jgi:hypothetical protein
MNGVAGCFKQDVVTTYTAKTTAAVFGASLVITSLSMDFGQHNSQTL